VRIVIAAHPVPLVRRDCACRGRVPSLQDRRAAGGDGDDGKYQVEIGGYCHVTPWQLLPTAKVPASGGTWSAWFDAGSQRWPLHERHDRAGGVAEWPAMKLTVSRVGAASPAAATVKGCALDVQLADRPDEAAVVHSFTEKSESDTIAFLLPTPRARARGGV
jgi:hypothetical protein